MARAYSLVDPIAVRPFVGPPRENLLMEIERAGGCVCGAVRYVTAGEPERVTLCHCMWCQRRTGTAFGTEVVFLKERVILSGIKSGSYRHISDESGRWLEIYFCPRCGTNLGLTLEAVPTIRSVP